MDKQAIDTVIFDLGGVLIDWNPEHLYRKIFDDVERMRFFLSEICTPEWNEEQDAGRPLREATEWLVARHPEWAAEIRAFYGRWDEMLGGVIADTEDILRRLHAQERPRLYALTNWSAETFPIAWERYDCLRLFEGILVSGIEKLKKPDPRIYRLLLDRYAIAPHRALFIDDNQRNVDAARLEGIDAHRFESPRQFENLLRRKGILS
jgi:2-haloacid dehalogenase